METHGIMLSLTLYGSALTGEISGGWLRNAACCVKQFETPLSVAANSRHERQRQRKKKQRPLKYAKHYVA